MRYVWKSLYIQSSMLAIKLFFQALTFRHMRHQLMAYSKLPGRIYSKYVVITASREGTKGVNSSWSAIRAVQAPHIIDTFVGFSVVYTDWTKSNPITLTGQNCGIWLSWWRRVWKTTQSRKKKQLLARNCSKPIIKKQQVTFLPTCSRGEKPSLDSRFFLQSLADTPSGGDDFGMCLLVADEEVVIQLKQTCQNQSRSLLHYTLLYLTKRIPDF